MFEKAPVVEHFSNDVSRTGAGLGVITRPNSVSRGTENGVAVATHEIRKEYADDRRGAPNTGTFPLRAALLLVSVCAELVVSSHRCECSDTADRSPRCEL